MSRNGKYNGYRHSQYIAFISMEIILLLFAFIFSMSVLIIVIRQLFYHKDFRFDIEVSAYFSSWVTDNNTSGMLFFSFFGSHYFLLPAWIFLLIFYYFTQKKKILFIKLLTIAVSNLLLMFGLKLLFNRPRPMIPLLKEAPGLSFPSGHAFMSFIFFGTIIYLIYRNVKNKWYKWGSILMLFILLFLIGVSRVYLRVHYPSDVIAGFCFGIMSLLIIFLLFRQIENNNGKISIGYKHNSV